MKKNKADQHLRQALHYHTRQWLNPGSGLVVAMLVDNSLQQIASSQYLEQKLHAERHAFQLFAQRFGHPSRDSIMITSLSPCIHFMDDRIGDSCVNLLKENDITRVHCGYVDLLHVSTLADYRKMGLNVTQTDAPDILAYCHLLYEIIAENRVHNFLPPGELKERYYEKILSLDRELLN